VSLQKLYEYGLAVEASLAPSAKLYPVDVLNSLFLLSLCQVYLIGRENKKLLRKHKKKEATIMLLYTRAFVLKYLERNGDVT
jgi:hypothetical protein